MAAASRQFELTPAETGGWDEDGKRVLENALPAKPEDAREQYKPSSRISRTPTARHAGDRRPQKAGLPAGKGRELMLPVPQRLQDDDVVEPMTKLCQWWPWPHAP
ncbi:hypothetical protein [Stenotrophomonas sp. YIM B06876]|uniref:hypothetical protein n=1 Tax=Stenotrophomonas sp. YIM B06876 TaxID=3060211 RepID=UPI00273939AA|nr:hypothetical protein [Stenotrophomonas sp. YIM B06876]